MLSDGAEPNEDESPEDLREDPKTGSTPMDPSAERTGAPPDGTDPMAGEAPSS
jgi:hypothetical protein